jgi:hypothetical protein
METRKTLVPYRGPSSLDKVRVTLVLRLLRDRELLVLSRCLKEEIGRRIKKEEDSRNV